MRAALEAHDEVLREAVEAHDGWLFKHTGDGICAAFASPRSAVDAAVAAQRALELPVRMGIATGEAELREDDYFGAVLNRAARVMAAGHGGQILLDGDHSGICSAESNSRTWDRDDYATSRGRSSCSRSEPRTAHRLPAAEDRSIRHRAISNRRRPASSDARWPSLSWKRLSRRHRLVTLTGVGGVGKTRLALEVAARLRSDFPDGVWVIELAPVGDPAAVPRGDCGRTRNHPTARDESCRTALRQCWKARSRLLVFDNCEHVLDAAAELIEAIVEHSSTVHVLATSREGLGTADEQLWPVPSLANTGVDSEAATLFAERAQHVAPEITLSAHESAGAVVEICRRLDGIPLAIELAASRMLSMTVTELRDRLDDRFRLLVGSRRGLERHQTLRHAVQWSYELLDDTEKGDSQPLLGVRRRIRPGERVCGHRRRRRVHHPRPARRSGSQVTSGRRPVGGADPILDARNHPTVRRRTTRGFG